MKKLTSLLGILFVLNVVTSFSNPNPDIPKQKNRTFINLLDYIGKDYQNAVQNGEIISEFEYKEMVHFGRQVADLHTLLGKEIDQPSFATLGDEISQLRQAIKAKTDEEKVRRLTSGIRESILKLKLVKVTPKQWPNLAEGKQIYVNRCQSCHGAKGFGDGSLASGLNPPPTSFMDSANTDNISPLQAYNTIRLGLQGTAMRSFSELSNQQVWDVAFYINLLNYKTNVSDSVQSKIKQVDTASLRSISLYTNRQ